MPTNVLIVDDEPNIRRSLGIGLRLSGFDVTEVDGSEAALEALGRKPFDLAIVDLMLPGVNGVDLARRVARDHPAVRILLTSAYHLSERQIRRMDLGVIGFIPKPFRIDDVISFFRERVDSFSRRSSAG